MSPFRPILAWLCSALMLFAGIRLQEQSTCAREPAGKVTGACCVSACRCCQQPNGASACACDHGRHPRPQPTAPAPHPEQAIEPQPDQPPMLGDAEPEPASRWQVEAGLPIGLLPQISRQKALSIWLC